MIGIITFGKYSIWLNYGAVLHAWAFQQFLNSMGLENEIIDYKMDELRNYNYEHPILSKKVKKRILWIIREIPYEIKKRKFESFYNKHMVFSKQSYTRDNASTLNYDIYICESDVIWSSATIGGLDDIFLCNFEGMRDSLRVSYAASTGDKIYSQEEKSKLERGLKNFNYISVRERIGVEKIQQLTDKTVTAVLDPVFLVDKSKYEHICGTNSYKLLRANEYVVVYIIGNGSKVTKRAKEFAKIHKKKVVELSTYPWNIIKNYVITTAGIDEFLWILRNSFAVFTNTFHGTALSIILEKNFFAFSSPNREGKITNILEICELMNRYNYYSNFRDCTQIDYSRVKKLLNSYIEESKKFIINAVEH